MSDRVLIVVLAAVVTVLAATLLAGHGSWAGAPLLRFSSRHGLHVGDLPVLVGWAAGMWICARLWQRR